MVKDVVAVLWFSRVAWQGLAKPSRLVWVGVLTIASVPTAAVVTAAVLLPAPSRKSFGTSPIILRSGGGVDSATGDFTLLICGEAHPIEPNGSCSTVIVPLF